MGQSVKIQVLVDDGFVASHTFCKGLHGKLRVVISIILVDAEKNVVRSQNVNKLTQPHSPFPAQEFTLMVVHGRSDEDFLVVSIASPVRISLLNLPP